MSDTQQLLQDLLHKIANEQKIQNYELKVTPISSGGANYSSTLYVATITNGTQNLELFIKVAAMKAKAREHIPIKIYDTEIYVYSELKTVYRELENKHQVPEKHRLRIPKYYGANTKYLEEILVLENLASQGFSVHDRHKSIDWEYAAAAVVELAKLHALSIAFRKEYPEQFKVFTEEYILGWLNEEFLAMWKTNFEVTLTVIREENKEKLKRFLGSVDLARMRKMHESLRCHVLTHGDYRPSNLMHKKRNNGSLEMIALDHQAIQIGCPVNDLLYLIVMGTDKAFRDQHYDQLVQFYYTQFREAMMRLDLDAEAIYSKADFEFEMKEKLPFGLAIAAYILPIVTVEEEHAPELNEDMDLENFNIQKTGALFPSRINGIVDDFVRWGVLND